MKLENLIKTSIFRKLLFRKNTIIEKVTGILSLDRSKKEVQIERERGIRCDTVEIVFFIPLELQSC